jgi:hypothetical protein
VARPALDRKLLHRPVLNRWYAVTRRRGLRVWVSWESQRVVANGSAIRGVGDSRGLLMMTKSDPGPFGGRAGEVADKLLDAVGSDLLDFGQLIITGMKSTTGAGDPETGEVFGQAQSTFHGVNETLKTAVPDSGWDGSGSYAYADQNTRQQLRSEAMADADHEVHKVLYREAAQITLRRGYLDDQYNFLATTSQVTFPLQFIPRYGEAMKLAIEIAALQAAVGESFHQMNQLQSEVAQNAAELQQAVGRYSGVADGAELPGAAVNFDPPPPPPGGDAPTSTPTAGTSYVSRGIESPPAGDSGPMITPGDTAQAGSQPIAGGPPALPQVPQLGSPLSPLGGLVTAAMPATGALAATPSPRRTKKSRRHDDEPTDDIDTADDDKDPTKAASRDGESERAPVDVEHDPQPDRLEVTVAAKLDSDNSPGPPAGTPPQDRR